MRTEKLNCRRQFLTKFIRLGFATGVANTSIYIVGSAFKSLDGNLTAGAKTWSRSYQTDSPFANGDSCATPPGPDPCSPAGYGPICWDGGPGAYYLYLWECQ